MRTSERVPRPLGSAALIVVAVVVAGPACAVEAAADAEQSDRSDDLVGRTVVVHPRERIAQLSGADARLDIQPELRVSPTTVEVWTDDVRMALPAAQGLAFVWVEKADVFDQALGLTHFGLRLEGRSAADGDRWRRLDPVPGDDTWNWNMVAIKRELDSTHRITGFAGRYTDVQLGTQFKQETRQIAELQLPVQPDELRFLVLPIWNFWEFDDSGYRATLVVD
jgi:hypothetical protein